MPQAPVLTTDTALAALRRLAAAAGFDEERPALAALWPAVEEWVALAVDGVPDRVSEMLLLESVLHLEPGRRRSYGPVFAVSFTRQFSHYDAAGEYVGMQEVGAEVLYDVHDDFRAITTMAEWNPQFGTADEVWSYPGRPFTEWADRVRATRSFRTALRHPAVLAVLFDSAAS